jgi:sigma-B regulation protein RsbU (phosphoserine phosphatase)
MISIKKKTVEVRPYIRKLESLIDAAKQLNSTFDLDKLLSIILNNTTKNLNASRGTIYLIDEQSQELWSKVVKGTGLVEIRLPIGTGISGTVAETGITINLKDASKDERFYSAIDKKSGFHTKTMHCRPMRNRNGVIIGVFQIINKKRGVFNRNDELFLDAFSEHASLAIENARLYKADIEHARVDKEIQIAAEMQLQLFPKETIQIPSYNLSAAVQPCAAIGGDSYDIIPLKDGKFAITMADVSGKGIPAALLVSTLHASLRVYLQYPIELVDLVKRLNTLVYNNSPLERFITFFIMIFDPVHHVFSYANAGHNPPLLFRNGGKDIIELAASGLPMGMVNDQQYEARQIDMQQGDTLVLYTDGVTEAVNKKHQQYGEMKLRECVLKNLHMKANEIKECIVRDVRGFVGNNPMSDDLTILIMKRGRGTSSDL